MANDDLISRAAAIEYLMTNLVWHDEDGYEVDDADEKRAIITDFVNGIPTVDAIPVEWLEEQAKDNYDYSGTLIRGLLSEWQKEQEAR